MKRLMLVLLLACAQQAQAKTIRADWPLMSYAGFMMSHASGSVQNTASAQGISFPGVLVFNPAGALVWAGSGAALMQQPAAVLSGGPIGSAKLDMVLAEFIDSSVGRHIAAGKPTVIVVVLGGDAAAGCGKCATVLADLAPQLAEDGRDWNIVEASVSVKQEG